MTRRRAVREIVHFQLILKDVKHSREILQVSESQADVLFIEIQLSDPVASRRVQSKIALLARGLLVPTHGRVYPRQKFRHLVELPIVENEDGRAVLLYGSEFHEGMIISSGVETDGDVFGPVFVDEKEASSRTRLGSNIRLSASA